MAKESQPGKIHLRIVEAMKRFPEGISGVQIRHELEREGIPPEDLGHLGRCIRELDKWFIIEKTTTTSTAKSDRQVIDDEGEISQALRAEVLYRSRGRCQRCGKTIKTDDIALVVVRKRPESSKDSANRDNMWAICEECNSGTGANLVRPMLTGARPRFECRRLSTIGRESRHKQ
jgi:5-methylcytosine-specific restriction endonuclease McrA